jgi:DNA mismatch endonuclease, patch repair protein
MQAQSHTRPEEEFLYEIRLLGLEPSAQRPPSPIRAKPDFVIESRVGPVAIFIDGCFWHGCPSHGTISKSNSSYWAEKLRLNRERDVRVAEQLMDAGWRVVRLWEHDDPSACAREVAAIVSGSEAASG